MPMPKRGARLREYIKRRKRYGPYYERSRKMPMPIKVKKKGGVACLEGIAKTLKPRKRR